MKGILERFGASVIFGMGGLIGVLIGLLLISMFAPGLLNFGLSPAPTPITQPTQPGATIPNRLKLDIDYEYATNKSIASLTFDSDDILEAWYKDASGAWQRITDDPTATNGFATPTDPNFDGVIWLRIYHADYIIVKDKVSGGRILKDDITLADLDDDDKWEIMIPVNIKGLTPTGGQEYALLNVKLPVAKEETSLSFSTVSDVTGIGTAKVTKKFDVDINGWSDESYFISITRLVVKINSGSASLARDRKVIVDKLVTDFGMGTLTVGYAKWEQANNWWKAYEVSTWDPYWGKIIVCPKDMAPNWGRISVYVTFNFASTSEYAYLTLQMEYVGADGTQYTVTRSWNCTAA